ncbi:Crp/Fnr family transcriptional regulator [Nocardia arthritidis]|uniref:Cyclic nucleotide-binding domain-containing protein n=1 Tax=Nocardia arthritidis TaxID=228602 RepID=A0A6G9YEB8_9NOCA|nr:cyclic nucleotide-binding domain-containing protein [Nocardia arthritidis]QIS11343.1 cyclic nucleotide-binding domain-containing protein [Nocardia arthritidis]
MTTAAELAEFAQLATLGPEELAVLAAAGHDVTYPTGHRLIVEGQRADRCWLIRDGAVLLDAQVPGRGDVVVQTLGSGDLLGWSWLVPPYRWHFGARTVDTVHAIEFDSATLAEFAESDPAFGHALTLMLFGAVLERLQATRARLLDLYRNPAETCTCTPVRIGGPR